MTAGKKLIEVALPLEAINAACKVDKDRKTGTIRNLHKWFAPMPPPALRALIFAAIVDDPGDQEGREDLFDLIRAFLDDDDPKQFDAAIRAARAEIAGSSGTDRLTVVDPFCGGGSTLVEAQRLGLQSLGSDLNPIPVLISRALVEYASNVRARKPLRGDPSLSVAPNLDGFLSDVKSYAALIRDDVQHKIGDLYPSLGDGYTPYAWFWARTVVCRNPSCRATIPLLASLWLSKAKTEKAWIALSAHDAHVKYEVETSGEPGSPPKVGRGGDFKCVRCGTLAPEEYVRQEAVEGRMSAEMTVIAGMRNRKRSFVPADQAQRKAANVPLPEDAPHTELVGKATVNVPLYGIRTQADLFLPRQLVMLGAFADAVSEVHGRVIADGGDEAYADAVAAVLGLCVGKLAQSHSTLVRWNAREGATAKAEPAFARHAIPMTWDFVEANPFGGSVGDWMQIVETALRAFGEVSTDGPAGTVLQLDARSVQNTIAGQPVVVVTDPPYFNQINYADLSDYFYVWIRRAVRNLDPALFSTLTTPKSSELVASPQRHNGNQDEAKNYFISGFTEVFTGLVQAAKSYPVVVIYAFRQQEIDQGERVSTGWEALLAALLDAKLAVVGAWPISGARNARMIGIERNALATYVAMVCRPRPAHARLGTRREFRTQLRAELGDAVTELQNAAIAPVDLAQAAIGPGMRVFSNFAKVVEADGTTMSVGTALSLINEVLDEILAEQEADFDPDTRWALLWFEQSGFEPGLYGAADALATAKNVAVNRLVEAGIIVSGQGKVRLLTRDELPESWDPLRDKRLTVWETTQQIIRALETGGEVEAAELLRQVGGVGEAARELAYRLFAICEKRKWAKEAIAYNTLVVAWPEIARLASAGPSEQPVQETLM